MKTTSEAGDFGVILNQAKCVAAKRVRRGRMIGGIYDSDDIAQEAAVLQWQRVEMTGAAVRFAMLKAWQYNAQAKRNRGGDTVSLSWEESDYAEVSEVARDLDGGFDSVDLDDLLATLPQDSADMLRLRFLEGYTLEEIGDVFGLERRVIARIVRQALEELRKEVDG